MEPGIFLSHNSKDKPLVETPRALLEAQGLPAWLDRYDIPADAPSEVWMPHVRAAVDRHPVALICLGPHGFGPIHQRELDAFLVASYQDEHRRVVPVLLPGARPEDLPLLLRPFTLIDLSGGLHPGPWIDALVEQAGGLDRRQPPTGSPYRALAVFDREHRDLFFGRTADTAALVDRLRQAQTQDQRFLVLSGASGAGKSSVVRAGLIPALEHHGADGPWRCVVLRVGERPPLEVLAASIGEALGVELAATALDGEVPADFDPQRTEGFNALTAAIAQGLDAPTRLLLVVDQAEELFVDPYDRARAFLAQLLCAAAAPGGPLTVLLTVRADHLHRLLDHSPALNRAVTAGQILLPGMRHDALRLAIEAPARLAGRRFEPGTRDRPGPVTEMIRALDAQPGHLPLLQFALDQLWRAKAEGDLDRATYEHIGRLEGAITRHADEVLTWLDEGCARYLLEELVHLGEGASDTRRVCTRMELLGTVCLAVLGDTLEALLQARLLTASGQGYQAWIELGHDVLVREWATLRRWIDESREVLRADREFEASARVWVRNGFQPTDLLRGTRFIVLHERINQPGRPPPPLVEEFHFASWTARRRSRVRWIGGTALVLSILVALGTYAVLQGRIAADRLEQGIKTVKRIGLKVQGELTSSRDVPTLRGKLLEEMDTLLKALDPDGTHGSARQVEATRLVLEGDTARERGDLKGAHALYEEALGIRSQLVDMDPTNPNWQRDLSASHIKAGELSQARGDSESAKVSYEAALNILTRLTESHPSHVTFRRDLGISHEKLGELAQAKGNLREAQTRYAAALTIRKRLTADDPSNADLQRDLLVSHIKLGDVALANGVSVDARRDHEAALAIAERLYLLAAPILTSASP